MKLWTNSTKVGISSDSVFRDEGTILLGVERKYDVRPGNARCL